MDERNQQRRKLKEGFKNAPLQAWLDMVESGLTHEQIWESVTVRDLTEDLRPPKKANEIPVHDFPFSPRKRAKVEEHPSTGGGNASSSFSLEAIDDREFQAWRAVQADKSENGQGAEVMIKPRIMRSARPSTMQPRKPQGPKAGSSFMKQTSLKPSAISLGLILASRKINNVLRAQEKHNELIMELEKYGPPTFLKSPL